MECFSRCVALRVAVVALCLGFSGCTSGGGDDPGPAARFLPVAESEVVSDAYGAPLVAAKDEALIFLREGALPEEVAAIRAAVALNGSELAAWDEGMSAMQVRGRINDEFLASLLGLPGVRSATRNIKLLAAGQNPRAPREAVEAAWGETLAPRLAPTVNGSWWIGAIRADRAWDVTEGDPSVTAAIVDGSLPFGQGLLDEGRVTRYSRDGQKILRPVVEGVPYVDPATESHGAAMAGFGFGFIEDSANYEDWFNEGGNVAGVDHAASLAFIKLPKDSTGVGGAWMSDLLTALDTALDKSDLVTAAYFADAEGCELSEDPVSCALARQRSWRMGVAQLLPEAAEKGALIILPAGNDGLTGDDWHFDYYDTTVEALMAEHVLTVGASRANYSGGVDISPFSRSGYMVDLFAPGEDIGFSQDGVNDYLAGPLADGTSFASALALGTASLVKAELPSLSPAEIRKVILDSSPPLVYMPEYGQMPHLSAYRSVARARALKEASFARLGEVRLPNSGEPVETAFSVTLPEEGFQKVDVVFLIDVTGSYWPAAESATAYAAALMEEFERRNVNAAFGVATFADYPFGDWGDESYGDRAFYMIEELNENPDEVIEQLSFVTDRGGGDGPESQLEALYQCATGEGRDLNGDWDYIDRGEIPPSSFGWRDGAAHYVILFTDVEFHNPEFEPTYPGPTWEETIAALDAMGIKVISIDSYPVNGDLTRISDATGGERFDLPEDSASFVELMEGALEWPDQLADVWCEVVSGNSYSPAFYPEYYVSGVGPGETVGFSLSLAYPWETFGTDSRLKDEVVVWVKANEKVIARYRVPVALEAAGE